MIEVVNFTFYGNEVIFQNFKEICNYVFLPKVVVLLVLAD